MIQKMLIYIKDVVLKNTWIIFLLMVMLLAVPIYDFSNYIHLMLYIAILLIYSSSCLIIVTRVICDD